MKKIILLPLLVLGIAYAGQTEQTEKANRVLTMQNLEAGMATIQKGMMYNNKSIIAKGVEEIHLNTKNISSFDIKNDDGVSFKAKKYSITEAKALDSLADNMVKAFKKGDKNRILDTYRRMQNQCMTCHAIVRKW